MTTLADHRTYVFEQDAAALWRALTGGEAADRDGALPKLRYRFEPDENGARDAIASARWGPVAISWSEPPASWEAAWRIGIERRFARGPIARYAAMVSIIEDDDETHVEHAFEIDSRNAFGTLLARMLSVFVRLRAERACRRAAQRARTIAADGVPVVPDASIAGVARFVDAFESLRLHGDGEPVIAARLAALTEHAPRAFLRHMRPHVLAEAWRLPPEELIAAMLAAAQAGLLTREWVVVCPRCRAARAVFRRLTDLQPTVHCEICRIIFSADFDRNVELTFALPAAADDAAPRALRPSDSRQVLAQRVLAAASTADFAVDVQPGAYVVQVLPDRVARFTVESDAGSALLEARVEPARVTADASVVSAGALRVRVTNVSARDVVVRIVKAPLARTMATAAQVTTLQAFRDLFPADILGENDQGTIRSLTFVCADAVGLDRIVAEQGDAQAARRVRTVVDALRDVVAAERGALVKSTGDGIFAVFAEPRDAVRAALRFAGAAAPLLELRVGVHRGPCLVVTANGRLDYVGAAVSTAARLGRTARAGEVLLTDAVADDPQVAEIMPAGDRGVVTLRGVPQPIEVTRIRPPALAAAR